MRKHHVTLRLAAALLMLPTVSLAQPTSTGTISLQGRLSGVPNGSTMIAVNFYDAQTGGALVASTPSVAATVTGGVFSAAVTPPTGTFDGRTLWWAAVVEGVEAGPRQLVTSVPYALALRDLFIDGTGQVGIGGSPNNTTKLQITGASDTVLLTLQNSNLDAPPVRFVDAGWDNPTGANMFTVLAGFAHPGGWNSGPSSEVLRYTGRSLALMTNPQGQPQGQVGIGTWSPQARLDVAGTTRTSILVITGGSDIAEPADVTTLDLVEQVEPGMVMVIDRERDGRLVPCSAAYDTAVAGVISGANGLAPGMVLKAEGQAHADGEHPLAMVGRVWVLCDADAAGPIARGDRLTTSATPGHAMRVGDEARAPGTVIGKAMTELKDGKGLVLVLVNLQ